MFVGHFARTAASAARTACGSWNVSAARSLIQSQRFSTFGNRPCTTLNGMRLQTTPTSVASQCTSLAPASVLSRMLGGVRWGTFGREYQPSTLKRKRRFGFLRRLRTLGGRKILVRRMLKGRKYLSH